MAESLKIRRLREEHDGKLPSYAWPGLYPLYYLGFDEFNHYSTYCPACANQDDAEPPILDYDVNWEDPDMYCDGCGKRIESAYADEEEENAGIHGDVANTSLG